MNQEVNHIFTKRINPDFLPPELARPAYVEENCLNADRVDFIYRIFSSDYLLNDINDNKITLACPSRVMHGDRYENMLLEKRFAFEGSNHFLLAGMMSQYYCQSWSSVPIALWHHFQSEHSEIRVKCNIGKLMDAIVRFEDPFYMLHYYLGKVEYFPEEVMQADLDARDHEDYLDSRGMGLLFTLLRVKDNHEDEHEVRLVYNRQISDDNEWIRENTSVFSTKSGNYCRHPMKWSNLIEDITIGPHASDKEVSAIKDKLLSFGIHCPVYTTPSRG